jgi:NAD(P)H-hydrate repair Nnr-like enzyme with NAD(P)H-hydrate dehydratase domain
LKGSGSVIAEPDGLACINPTGNPALATAGTGDVLAGTIGSLLAQQLPAADAARLGVYLHGQAADLLVEQGLGPRGLTASELIPVIRSCLNRMASDQAGMLDSY